jgi:hypothetical protein
MNQLPGGGLCDDCAGPECEVGGSTPPPPPGKYQACTFVLRSRQTFILTWWSWFCFSVVIATVPATVKCLNVTPSTVYVLKFNWNNLGVSRYLQGWPGTYRDSLGTMAKIQEQMYLILVNISTMVNKCPILTLMLDRQSGDYVPY